MDEVPAGLCEQLLRSRRLNSHIYSVHTFPVGSKAKAASRASEFPASKLTLWQPEHVLKAVNGHDTG